MMTYQHRSSRTTWERLCGRILRVGGLALLLAGSPGGAQQTGAGAIQPEVVEVARTYDLAKKEEFLTVTLEIAGPDPLQLRRVQPLREDFQVLVGKAVLPCRWLRGGSLPEDPQRLRFTLGFSMPDRKVKSVDLRVNLPRLPEDNFLEIRLEGLQGGKPQPRRGEGWALTVQRFGPAPYQPPSLPPKGQFLAKKLALDARVFRKAAPPGDPPAEAVVLAFGSGYAELFDPTLDVSGHLLLEGGGATPLLSASLRRVPARTVKESSRPVEVSGQLYFQVPPKGRPTGALVRFHRRPAHPPREPQVLKNLPVPGRS